MAAKDIRRAHPQVGKYGLFHSRFISWIFLAISNPIHHPHYHDHRHRHCHHRYCSLAATASGYLRASVAAFTSSSSTDFCISIASQRRTCPCSAPLLLQRRAMSLSAQFYGDAVCVLPRMFFKKHIPPLPIHFYDHQYDKRTQLAGHPQKDRCHRSYTLGRGSRTSSARS